MRSYTILLGIRVNRIELAITNLFARLWGSNQDSCHLCLGVYYNFNVHVVYAYREGYMLTCQRCQEINESVVHHRQNTQFPVEEDNFVTLCVWCRLENDRYWDEMWEENRWA